MTAYSSELLERFFVTYRFYGALEAIEQAANALAIEQTVELPNDLIPAGIIRDVFVGRIERITPVAPDLAEVTVSYANATVGDELTQLLNVIFGNSSLIPDIRVVGLELPDSLLRCFRGPRFGQAGLRQRLDVHERPLLCTALKPLGLGVEELADLAYRCALGGVDLIKDDHGLTNQPSAPFAERVARCADAVERANRQTGEQCIYIANVTAPADQIIARARMARGSGAGGVMIAPSLAGIDAIRQVAADDRVDLPILSHPAFSGGFIASSTSGIGHGVLFGTFARLAGADATIFPNDGGRFPFSQADCAAIAAAASAPLGHMSTIFPVPAGGVALERVPELIERYGKDVILLLGGSLLRSGAALPATARKLRTHLEQCG